MNGAQSLFKALTDAGLDTCFANPGTSEMQLVYEIVRRQTIWHQSGRFLRDTFLPVASPV